MTLWQFLKVALCIRGSASSSAWHVGNEGLFVSFQQQTHRGRPRWWQVSAEYALQLSHIHWHKQTADRRDPIYHQARLTAQGSTLKKKLSHPGISVIKSVFCVSKKLTSPMRMIKPNFLEYSLAFLERNYKLSQRRRLDLLPKLNKHNHTEGFYIKHTHRYTHAAT